MLSDLLYLFWFFLSCILSGKFNFYLVIPVYHTVDCLAPCIERNIALYLPLHKTTPLTFVFFLFCLFPSSSIRVLYSKDSPLHICFRLWLNAYIFFCNPFPSTPRFFPSFFFFFFSFHQGFRSLSPLVGFQFLMAS